MAQQDFVGVARPEGAPPALVTSLDWPPLINPTQLPWLVRARDLALTLAAWLACAVVLRKFIVNLIAWVSPPLGERLKALIPIDYAVDTSPFLWIASGLVLVLMLSGISRRHYLRRMPSTDHDVPPLPPATQFESAGVSTEQLDEWRRVRCLHLRQSADGRMTLVARDEAR